MGILRKILHNLTLGIVESDEQIEARRKKREKEYDQSVAEDFKRFNDYNYRKNQAFSFDSRMSFEEFKALAINIAKPIKRLYVEVESHYVKGTVRTISGLDYWKFEETKYVVISRHICFDLDNKSYSTTSIHEIAKVDMPTFKAICKQLEELGWI